MRHFISQTHWLCIWCRLTALTCLAWTLVSCEKNVSPPNPEEQSAPTATIERPAPSSAASKWLTIAEDETNDIQDRITAVYELRKLKEPATAERLIKLLPGNYGAFTLEIVAALGKLKDPRALPALKSLYNEENIMVPGKIRAELKYAIRACGGDPKDPK